MADSETSESPREHVRSIGRGLAVLQAINRGGSISMMQICREAQVPYPTACRIVATLIDEGMIEREPARKRYRPTALVKTLAVGYQEEDDLIHAARPHIVALCRAVGWPISVCTRVGNSMMVRDSTHRLTSLTLNNYAPGYTLPLTECSTGKAWLAHADPDERARVLEGLKRLDGPAERMATLLTRDSRTLEDIRTRGYATQARNSYTATPGKTSSLAVPLFRQHAGGGQELVGAMALIFFASAMPMARAEAQFIPDLKRTATLIAADMAKVSGG
ncbi:IclR family transcriptional regulator domain-containing protein [Sandaracinobacteroides saxicola]|uniref:Helix-turn-helix domain-containing protein n=1 Tax=Sandaracinobacteroides saxicola TaxID=2759707 RepID=A0A7G5IEU8_9SPHN|nr:helix-turn-helix domain-containing protein [Sandaracinobacteroides saxicola]QMW21890.1 helix-turn-helix domain-containing protein [Sandaracinobacteroides saxicola]